MKSGVIGTYSSRSLYSSVTRMRVKVFERADGATVLCPVGIDPASASHGPQHLDELGEAELDLACLSPPLVTALGLQGFCEATGDDVLEVLRCLSAWRASRDCSLSLDP